MDVFTEVYDKSRDLLKTTCFDQRWSNIEPQIKALLAADGFNEAEADVLDLIRTRLRQAGKDKPHPSQAMADEILALARPDDTGFQERAALLKTLRHVYRVARRGAQAVWVVDHPKAYDKWAYDKAAGAHKPALKTLLAREQEAFGAGNRQGLIPALQLAQKISMDTCVKLSNKTPRAKRKVRKWFLAPGSTDEEVEAAIATLQTGFKKITALCNANTIIFSDRPHRRSDKTKSLPRASVNSRDTMPVIYVYRPFLQTGRKNDHGIRSQLWMNAKTIIHEISHKILSTDDHAYGFDGIRPGTSLTPAEAITNADSWGIFALDLAGYLPRKTAKEAFS